MAAGSACAALIAAACLGAGTLSADSLTVSPEYIRLFPALPSSLPWGGSVSFPKFDPSIGSLKEVRIDFQGAVFGSIRAENLAPQAVNAVSKIGAKYHLARPDNSPLGNLDTSQSITSSLGAYDGALDFGGSSGVNIFFGLGASGSSTYVANGSSADLTLFTGTGDITLNVAADDDSGVDVGNNPKPEIQSASTGRAQVNVTYRYQRFSMVGDLVWRDSNANGVIDPGEEGIGGIPVELTFANGNPVPGIPATTTDVFGNYLFTNVPPGNYRVTITPGPSDTATYDVDGNVPNQSDIEVKLGEDRFDVDFGLSSSEVVTLGTIGDRVWWDSDGSASEDPGEQGIPGIIVQLEEDSDEYSAPGRVIAQTVTDITGTYHFQNVLPGWYTVRLLNPPGPDIAEETYDMDGNYVPHCSYHIAVGQGESFLGADFGYYPYAAALGGIAWNDLNANQQIDSGEPRLSGLTVIASSPSGTFTTTTGPDGSFGFAGVQGAATYNVSVMPPPGFSPTYDLDGINTPNIAGFYLDASEIRMDINFGFHLSGGAPSASRVGDRIWDDLNANGIQESNEPGLAGWVVELVDDLGTVAGTTTTDANGNYRFDVVVPAVYQVRVTPGAGYVPTYDLDGTATPSVAQVTVGPSSTNNNVDFGYRLARGRIGDFVWVESDGNGVYNAGEAGLANVGIIVIDSSNMPVASTTTGTNGAYLIDNLPPGTYSVVAVPPAYYYATYDLDGLDIPNSAIVTVAPGQSRLDADFGYKYQPPVGSIGDMVWSDDNGNGIMDSNEGAVGGAIVSLKNLAGQTIATVTTPSTGTTKGQYLFTALPPGNYIVSVQPPAYYTPTYDLDGVDTPNTTTVALAIGEARRDVDFGYIYSPPPGSISGYIWNDANRNAAKDSSETMLSGVSVVLLDSTGVRKATNVTAAAGTYSFSGLGAGVYSVIIDPPPALYSPTYDIDGMVTPNVAGLSLGIGENRANVNFGYALPDTQSLKINVVGRIWKDIDGNGFDDLEPGLQGWTVTLKDQLNNVIQTMTTDISGNYKFASVTAGTLKVVVTPQAGYVPTYDPDGISTPNSAVAVTLPGLDLTSFNFGYGPDPAYPSIGDRVWKDANWNAAQDPSEVGLVGWTVQLKNTSGIVIATTVTGTDGKYLFAPVMPGTYQVAVARPGGYTETYDLDGLSSGDYAVVTVTGGQHRRDVDFGYNLDNAKPPSGRGCTPGFWSNKNGQALETQADFAVLTQLHLVNGTGAAIDFTGALAANKTALANWFKSANAVSMAEQLSRHLAAFQLNVLHSFYLGGSVIPTPGCNTDGFMTASQLIAAAESLLTADNYTPAGDPNRTMQELVKNALDAANNNATR